ncbi:LysR family transcriptional regulator [Agrobacterium tumefaciens]|uniref:LysR substrate-binding domain-containing protein n=1 Tax=Agrobacterium tumefaciens TaxID=358 RepID=UPI0015729BEE|nr:LysR substrate-binding domain-containing protein [Agrobacterium tumefaciens]NTE54495.1 LysR family transcriptional regulator [Agrobacterium tumefaciens]NTE73343.1 LysR family transcriptional regulator [Agrobacterium tumefaciens]
MEVKWLEDFLALAGTLNFSKAADERHVTQSAFSRRIKQLEAWVGATLVDRASYPSRLTEAGVKFVPVAQETLKQLYHARRTLLQEEGADARTVRLTALHTLSFTFFPDWLKRVNETAGPLFSVLRPDSGSMEENLNSLVDGQSDFLLTYAHPEVPMLLDAQTFEFRVLGAENIIPVSAPAKDGSPLHGLVENARKPFAYLDYEKASFFGPLLRDLLSARLPQFERVHEGSMSVGLKAMAMAGWGVAWVPESLMRHELDSGALVRAADSSFDIAVDIRLYRSKENRRPVVERIWAVLEG